MHSNKRRYLLMVALTGLFITVAAEVLAVVGRPLTPVSYAGVARRSVRRNAY